MSFTSAGWSFNPLTRTLNEKKKTMLLLGVSAAKPISGVETE
jgi:hypothetical protein